MADIVKTDNCVNDIKALIEQGRQAAYSSVNLVMINTYWNVGRRIVEEEQNGSDRAEYGDFLVKRIAEELLKDYGSNFNYRNICYYRKFYLNFSDLEIVNTRVHNLTWSHFRTLLRVADEDARIWYMKEANEQMWSVRTLDRNISTQYYQRLLHSPKKEAVIAEMQEKTSSFQQNKFELLKSPYVAEFLGYKTEDSYTENELETSILSHIRDFLMEMGKGFAFVARQQHIVTDMDDYYIDLVFYNNLLITLNLP
ncbi:MAG: PDDEXK nuclease domain-containing protein [Paludibacteraceae bacterium]|nr:PDDEXK nuclease domain-containing protein [Paludibacteraceae bacterium]